MAKSDKELLDIWAAAGGSVEAGKAVLAESQLLPFLREITRVPANGMLVEPERIEAGSPDVPNKAWRAAQRLAGMLG